MYLNDPYDAEAGGKHECQEIIRIVEAMRELIIEKDLQSVALAVPVLNQLLNNLRGRYK